MTQIGYLDTGVLIGFCLTVDSHHEPCSEYLSTVVARRKPTPLGVG